MRDFLQRLFTNPNFAGQPTSVIENLIINFIDKNAAGLQPIFKSPEYFPDKEWDETRTLLINELRTMVIEELKPRVKRVMSSTIDFNALNSISGDGFSASENHFDEIWEFYEKIMTNAEVRLRIDNVTRLIEGRLIDSYLRAAVEKHGYTYNELFRADGVKVSPEEYTEVLKVCAMLRPAIFIAVPQDVNNMQHGTFFYSEVKGTAKLKVFSDNLKEVLSSSLPTIPERVLDILIDSMVEWDGESKISGAGRFLNIMTARAKDLRLKQKVAKGADTPDKSWFSIAMRNARFLGQDKSMLEDLNRLAFELRK